MRHRRGYRKLGKATDQRLALLRSLALALFQHNRIQTTVIRAREVRRLVERVVTLAKRGDLPSRRRAVALIPNRRVIGDVFSATGRFADREGGYTRIVPVGFRRGDSAPLAILELI